MQIDINKHPVELTFGIRFVREIDKSMGMEANGIRFGAGLSKALPSLQAYDTATLSDVIHAATVKASPRPSADAIDEYIESLDAKEQDQLFTNVKNELLTANATKLAAKNLKA